MQESHNFEQALMRLEQILEEMNSGKASLDSALNLYEEADKLITTCNKQLNEAEQKIETLVKNRSGELVLNEQGLPSIEPFSTCESTC